MCTKRPHSRTFRHLNAVMVGQSVIGEPVHLQLGHAGDTRAVPRLGRVHLFGVRCARRHGHVLHRRVHESTCLLWPAVLAAGPLWFFEMFMCMSYNWGITITVHMHRGPIMFKVQLVICSSWTKSTLERSHAFVIGDVVQVQRR